MMQRPKIDEKQMKVLQHKAFRPLEQKGGLRPFGIKAQIKDIMWKYANVADRTKEGLETAIGEIEKIKVEKLPYVCTAAKNRRFNLEWGECLELENIVTVAEMTLKSALTRTESRGLHYREDFPRLDANWIKNVVIRKKDGEMEVSVQPVALPYVKPEKMKEVADV